MALTMLEYGMINEAPIIIIIGEIGSGKTTPICHLLNTLEHDGTIGPICNTHKALFGAGIVQYESEG